MYVCSLHVASPGMSSQETKYWIGHSGTRTLRSFSRRAIRVGTPVLIRFSQLPPHRFQPGQRRQRPSAARLEQDRFHSALEHALHRTRTEDRTTHALLALDLDGFTRVQASFGAVAVDRLLNAIAQRVCQCLGAEDAMWIP